MPWRSVPQGSARWCLRDDPPMRSCAMRSRMAWAPSGWATVGTAHRRWLSVAFAVRLARLAQELASLFVVQHQAGDPPPGGRAPFVVIHKAFATLNEHRIEQLTSRYAPSSGPLAHANGRGGRGAAADQWAWTEPGRGVKPGPRGIRAESPGGRTAHLGAGRAATAVSEPVDLHPGCGVGGHGPPGRPTGCRSHRRRAGGERGDRLHPGAQAEGGCVR